MDDARFPAPRSHGGSGGEAGVIIPDASGQFRAATIADGSPSRGGWVTAPASKPPAVVVARFDGLFLWRDRQTLIH